LIRSDIRASYVFVVPAMMKRSNDIHFVPVHT
jgi:hypothetical protein